MYSGTSPLRSLGNSDLNAEVTVLLELTSCPFLRWEIIWNLMGGGDYISEVSINRGSTVAACAPCSCMGSMYHCVLHIADGFHLAWTLTNSYAIIILDLQKSSPRDQPQTDTTDPYMQHQLTSVRSDLDNVTQLLHILMRENPALATTTRSEGQ